MTSRPDTQSPRAALETALKGLIQAHRADKKGKFPVAALKASADGSKFDMAPLTVAMTEASWENIRAVYNAAAALLSGQPSDGSS